MMKKKSGQSIAEYSLILVLVAVISFAGFYQFADSWDSFQDRLRDAFKYVYGSE